jgi:hypothetical protein
MMRVERRCRSRAEQPVGQQKFVRCDGPLETFLRLPA